LWKEQYLELYHHADELEKQTSPAASCRATLCSKTIVLAVVKALERAARRHCSFFLSLSQPLGRTLSITACMAHTPSSSTSHSREHNSRFKEHLSLYVPPFNYPVESSRFSPESPELPQRPPPPPRALSTWTNTATMRSSTHMRRDYDAPATPESSSTNTASKSRIARLLFDIRTLARGGRESELVPTQPAQLPPWPPLTVEKRTCCHDCPCHSLLKDRRKTKWRQRTLVFALIIILLYLLANLVVLDIKIFGVSSTGKTANLGMSSTLSADAQQCISQYTVNAPSDPSGYPCASCLPVLQTVNSSTAQLSPQDQQTVQNAVQFCSLRSVFEAADSNGQSALKSGNWGQDVKFCAWSGVACASSGQISSLLV
jgi:hypothetical protein